jgi:hypothetical protein
MPSAYASSVADGADLIPELDLARIRRYCAGRIPARIAHFVRLEIDVESRSVAIPECRPPLSPGIGWS